MDVTRLSENLNHLFDRCEKCGIRPKYRDKQWCGRCIDIYRRGPISENRILEDIPVGYCDADVLDFKGEIELVNVNSMENYFFCGDVGTGKTHMMYALLKEAKRNGLSGRVIEFMQICSEIRKGYDCKSGPTEWDVIKKYSNYDILFLDDLGLQSGQVSDFTYLTFYQIIDKRINNYLPTIISSNKTPEQIGLSFDSRIASRLQTFKIIEFKGKDRRKNE
ncbi:MAG: ATP-binding protein [Patescibacteria group bacterium]|jgi:DNA replication protein DnaC